MSVGLTLGGPHVHPVAAVEIDVGAGLSLRVLVLATTDGNVWDPGRGSTNDLGRNDLWSLARAEVYLARTLGQLPMEAFV